MKRIKLLFLFLIFVPLVAMSQNLQSQSDLQKASDLQKVKDALVNSVIYCQALEKQNDNLNALIKKVADDLKKVTTIEQLDSLKVVYGIEPKKLTKNGSNK
jgi:hypothetical protein